MKKRAMALILVLLLAVSVLPMPAAAAYQVRYESAAQALWQDGLFNGDGVSFNLDQPLSRLEGAVMIVRLLGKEEEAKACRYTCPFTDVDPWARDEIGYAVREGIVSGRSAAVFDAKSTMPAYEFLTLVLRVLGYNDRAGDFQYREAAGKALEVGLIGPADYAEYTAEEVFRRDNVAQICYMALGLCKKGTSDTLRSTIIMPGRPGGKMPCATAAEAAAADREESGSPSSGEDEPWRNCAGCGGTGKVFCSFCGGTGQKASTGFRKNETTGLVETYTFNATCPTCSGTGRSLCPACEGTGHLD